MFKKFIILIAAATLMSGCTNSPTNVPQDYPPDAAIKNGDFVNLHGNFSNIDKLVGFMDSVSKGKEDFVRIVSYTIEGDPIVEEISYDGEELHYLWDNSRDAYGSPNITKMVCGNVESVVTDKELSSGTPLQEQSTAYYLTDCNDGKTRHVLAYIPKKKLPSKFSSQDIRLEMVIDESKSNIAADEIAIEIINSGSKDVQYGEDYYIEVSKYNTWVFVPFKENTGFTLEAHILKAGDTHNEVIHFDNLAAPLSKGLYRVVKELSSGTGNVTLAAEFEVSR